MEEEMKRVEEKEEEKIPGRGGEIHRGGKVVPSRGSVRPDTKETPTKMAVK